VKIYIKSLFIFLFSLSAFATQTDYLIFDRPEDFMDGKFQSAVLSSKGKIYTGKELKPTEIDATAVWSLLELAEEQVLIGTGNRAKLFLYNKGKLEEIFQDKDPDRIAISELALGALGEVYFSVIPKSAVYKMEKKNITKLAEPNLPYIWTLLPLDKGELLAGGGPKAGIILIKKDGSFSKILELNAEQVMNIIPAGDNNYLATTARPAMVIKFQLDGSYQVLYSFTQEEVRAIKLLSDQSLLIAVNQGPSQPPTAGEPEEEPPPSQETEEPQAPPPPQAPAGRAIVFQLYPDRGLKQIFALKVGTIISLFGNEKIGFFLGTDDQGRVYQIFPDQEETLLSFDTGTGRVVSFAGTKQEIHWLGTAQPARLIKIIPNPQTSYFQSNTIDLQIPARFGNLTWKGIGNIKFETRTGNTKDPDSSWSNWQEVKIKKPAPETGGISSPLGRFIQVRATWTQPNAEIHQIKISFQPINQNHFITALGINIPNSQTRTSSNQRTSSPNQSPASALKQTQISWRVDNPDQDQLYFELFLRKEGDQNWTKIASGQELNQNQYQFDASELEDGWFRIKLTASDSPNNPEPVSFQTEKISYPFLIDTTKPELEFKITNGIISGTAQDKTSAISSLEYALDEKKFQPLSPLDQILDDKIENFELKLKGIQKGIHQIRIRACDQADNCQVKSKEFNLQ